MSCLAVGVVCSFWLVAMVMWSLISAWSHDRACVRACLHVCVRACVCAYMHVR